MHGRDVRCALGAARKGAPRVVRVGGFSGQQGLESGVPAYGDVVVRILFVRKDVSAAVVGGGADWLVPAPKSWRRVQTRRSVEVARAAW
ncbi:hypothetical protein OG762_08360 [Streptomyces sp. NBC_01136]|uniref:hypothetical protein n=1 Tax=Streptomyces sp. NBC_01136 TaxID=2903754 RepID=UPI00386E2DCC|nr:hypothetical protein OG762_08360 [Streptomyces sp. NBC_01136]